MSLNHLATRFGCTWPWETLVLTCDGRVVCGCADPYVQRVLGDARTQSMTDIWNGPAIHQLRTDLNGGGSTFCGDCPLKLPLDDDQSPSVRDVETGPTLGRVDFFNYGETFLHKRAVEMCEYIKQHHPQIYLYTSTNGLALDEDRARRLVHSGIDEVTFSVDGATPDSYARYRQRGDFERALANMRAMTDEKRQSERDVPFINWRYILFTWNDSQEEMDTARTLAAEIGVDRLTWEITDHPESAFSRRFAPGTTDHTAIRREIWDDNNLGNAIPGATPRAEIAVSRLPGIPLVGRSGAQLRLRTRVRNLSTRAFPAQASYGRRLVRLGAQLCTAEGQVTNRDHARAWLPDTLEPGQTSDVEIDIPLPDSRGRYRMKFDLVSEGIDWFEDCGSPTTSVPLLVW